MCLASFNPLYYSLQITIEANESMLGNFVKVGKNSHETSLWCPCNFIMPAKSEEFPFSFTKNCRVFYFITLVTDTY